MIEAARQHGRVMQHGTQSRSSAGVIRAMGMLREGVIGDVLVAKHVNSQKRRNIGHVEPSPPPAHVDYDLWVGPAEWAEHQSNYVHYHWHWFYNFGTGDIGNDGVHGIDLARWGLGVETHPSLVTGYGSKLYFDDDQEFPDTYTVTFAYPGASGGSRERLLVYEQRIWSPYRNDDQGNNLYFYGTEGMMTLGEQGIRIYGEKNELIRQDEQYKLTRGVHQKDFVDAIRSGGRPVADIEVGHLSSTLSHLGNIVARTNRSVRFDPDREQIVGDEEANALLGRRYRSGHWAIPS
jgi:predicted dehydrogenase